MRVARFWARAQAERDGYGRGAWASSETSIDDARQRAEEKARRLLAEEIESDGEVIHQYAYQQRDFPEPIVQDLRDNAGDRIAAITINRYGANVLNTARLAFIDVDLEASASSNGGGLLGRLLGRKQPATDPTEEPLERLRHWARQDASRGARVYRTAAGLRYLLTSPGMEPDGDDAHQLMEELGADPLYARLCRAQRSFRARLSPKPWRIGIRGTPKLSFEKLAEASEPVNAWLRHYEQACKGYSVCNLIDEVGNTRPPDDDTARLIALHDDLAGVGLELPLA
ncbi:MAG: hypothetical protein RIE77_08010 [Phycisphaerales bacterium]|jgi:hypothetical protein